MGILSLFKRKNNRDVLAERRAFLLTHGRITDGRIIDTETNGRGDEIVFYLYTLNGVDFESSELLSEEQRCDPLRYAPGAKVAIRYDPRNQGNSMLV
ncbi:MAG TPA: hypothetical protein VNA22_01220 [Pyrinomonadaceae bacterium]|nr:hypothetical protein [Pyrinomonadaceae bacterium]